MPSVYTHYRFGARILPALPADVREPILRHRALFDAGLQGPDFFFFYKPATKGPIHDLGREIHGMTGREFFTRACRNLGKDTDEEALSYLYGLLGHYCLDSLCHPLVHAHSDDEKIGHNALESEFERYLLALDGVKRPHAYRRNAHLKLRGAHYARISIFYPPATPGQIREAFDSMVLFLGLMTCGNDVHRFLARGVLKSLGKGQTGLLIPAAPDPDCAHLNTAMLERFNEAVAQFPDLLEQLRDHLTFREPFGPEFDRTFG